MTELQFFVLGRAESVPGHARYPFVTLETDNWDDYGFKTLFHPVFYLNEYKRVDLRDVKIMQFDQRGGRTQVPSEFNALDESYCSLGQELAYYESLLSLDMEDRTAYLAALRDAAFNPNIHLRFKPQDGFGTSLLRWGPAERALEDAPAILVDSGDASNLHENQDYQTFTFHTKFGSNEFATRFRYNMVQGLPGLINAIIGYNGTGKTQLLANLAWVARADLRSRGEKELIDKFGRLDPPDLRFGGVVAISYSAFDTFELPPPIHEDHQNGSSDFSGEFVNVLDEEGFNNNKQFGYTYCGLRYNDNRSTRGLKDPEEIEEDVRRAIARIDTDSRRNSLHQALQPLRNEPSFKRAEYKLDLLGDSETWTEEFKSLSTGHKISVNIIVQLVAALQQGSLVLIDEPEAHLHPPLLAALMRGIGSALNSHRSYAVIATHSPVVLQEIAGCYAHVLRRHGSQNFIEEPSIETFGENIGLLTRHVFNLDNSESDYVGALRDLASKRSFEQIEELFKRGLSSQARAILMQEKRN